MNVGDLVRLKYIWASEPNSGFRFGIVVEAEYFLHTVPIGHEGWYVVTVLWESGNTTREPKNALVLLKEAEE